jgi:hypothetical protein
MSENICANLRNLRMTLCCWSLENAPTERGGYSAPLLCFSRRFVLQVRRTVDVLIDKNRVPVRIH